MKTEKGSLEAAMRMARRCEHPHCFACGEPVSGGLGLSFELDREGEVVADWIPPASMESYPGILHGGIIATLLDSAMVQVLFAAGIVARTGDLHIRFRMPVLTLSPVQVRAGLRDQRPPLFRLEAVLWQKGIRCAYAEAKFMSTSEIIKEW